MANTYGVANPLPLPVIATLAGGADVALPAGVQTTIASATIAGLDPSGFYFPEVIVQIGVLNGAAAPTAFQYGAKIGAGSNFDFFNVAAALLVNNATLYLVVHLIGGPSQAPWQGGGSVVNLNALATTNAATAKFAGSRAVFRLWRAPDQ